MTTHRTWLLLRRLDDEKSLFFVPHVRVDEDRPAQFSASVVGLENRMLAAGCSIDEAEGNAIDMFQVLVDHAIESNAPLGFELGDVAFSVVPVTFKQAGQFFAAFDKFLSAANAAGEEWRSVPTSVLVASQKPVASDRAA